MDKTKVTLRRDGSVEVNGQHVGRYCKATAPFLDGWFTFLPANPGEGLQPARTNYPWLRSLKADLAQRANKEASRD